MTRTLDATRRCSTFRARPIVWLRLPRSHCIPESIIFLHGYCAGTCQGDSRIGRNLCWLDCTPRKLETVACTTQCLHSRLHSFSRTSESTNVCLFVCLTIAWSRNPFLAQVSGGGRWLWVRLAREHVSEFFQFKHVTDCTLHRH